MNMYLGYFAMEENMPDDNAPIGIIMSRNKDELLVEYATYGMDSNLFVSKYELYLPNREDLERLVSNILKDNSGEAQIATAVKLFFEIFEMLNNIEKDL